MDTLGLKTEEEDVWLAVQMDSRPCDKEMETSSYNLSLSNSVLFPTGLPDELSWPGRHFCDTVNPAMPCPTSEQQKQEINGEEE